GLSYAGVREAARRMGYLELFDLKVEEKDEAWYASVRGRDNIRCLTLYGVSYQSKKMRLKDGTITDDPYAYVKAANKACRNALRALLPEKVVNETIEYFLELGAKPVRPPAPERPPAPPKPEPVEMEVPSEERKLAEGIWMPIKASDGREYGTLKVIEPGVLRVEFDQPLPLDPALEAGPGGWMKRQLDAIRDKDGREGYRFEWKPEWVGEFLASLTLEMERPLDEKRLKHLETVFSWPAMRSLQRV
ncbi:MAG: hypothetical protein QMD10_10615, partial [Desulfitobacteriaceae bacterium]|nr:hypothetical protein [Desulfitobacteriaceae bacterium]